MTRGQRAGELTRTELAARIERAQPAAWIALPKTVQKRKTTSALLGHAIHYGLVSKFEIDETIPRDESTLPCYLYTYIVDDAWRQKIQQYVVAASKLFRRGSLILNLVAQSVCGPRLPGAADVTVTVLRPRFSLAAESAEMVPMRAMAAKLEGAPESNILKHAFLPERWPSNKQPRCADVEAVLGGTFSAVLPPAPTEWLNVMTVSGWDNAINRMMSKTCGNLKVHATAQLPKAVRAYLGCAPMDIDTPRWLLIDCVLGRPRPLIAHNDDWTMATELRRVLAGVPAVWTEEWHSRRMLQYDIPDKVDFSDEVLLLHFFLVRYGVAERTYLPVASRGRKYAYIDAKVAGQLFGVKKGRGRKRKAAAGPSSTGDGDGGEDSVPTVSVGELLGLTPAAFNRRRHQVRREVRQRYRKRASTEADSDRRRRLKKQAKRWRMIGASAMPKSARVDSIETDGVGLRLILKTPHDITKFVKPLETTAELDAARAAQAAAKPKRGRKRVLPTSAPSACETHPSPQPTLPEPVMVAMDLGRAKLFAAAVSRRAVERPKTVVLTRRRYYFEMCHGRRRRWEEVRMAAVPAARDAVMALSLAGSINNSDSASWMAYLAAETAHRQVLDDEFVSNVDRARWRMVMHRGKRRCLDSCVQGLLRTALEGIPRDRPLVVGIGNAGFPSNGPRGELPAPTSELSKAMKRGMENARATGRTVTALSLDEFRTTLCCCACGSRTVAPTVAYRYRDRETREMVIGNGKSRRLRCCTTCSPTGKLRDRDVQASRNILWLAMAEYYGCPRPEYLCRVRAPQADNVDQEHQGSPQDSMTVSRD